MQHQTADVSGRIAQEFNGVARKALLREAQIPQRDQLANRLRRAPEHFGTTILIIEHDLDLVRSVCSRITVLNFGEVLASGDRAEVLNDPKVVSAYMGETEML